MDERPVNHPEGGPAPLVSALLFDFGGVLAEEGFRDGLMAAALQAGLDPDWFFTVSSDLAYESGYVQGFASETTFWNMVRAATGITFADARLRDEILTRFILRPWMCDLVRRARRVVGFTGILSDQTDWLDRLNEQLGFFHLFDKVFNSYHLGKTKKDAGLFIDIAREIGAPPDSILFVDDNPGHVERARSVGFKAHLFVDRPGLASSLAQFGLGGALSLAPSD